MSNPVLKLEQTEIKQANKLIISIDSLSINPGELVYLVGKTGSGKTSLLRTLYADLDFNGKSGLICGFDLAKINSKQVPFLRRKLGIIFQDFQLLTDRTVFDNLTFIMKATGWQKSELMKSRIKEVLVQVGLLHKYNNYPHELSGGEQQRVVIARALLNEPFVLLADEPTGNLDPETSKEIHDLLISITQQGTALFMATHNYNLIHYYPSRVLQLDNGKINEVSPANLVTI